MSSMATKIARRSDVIYLYDSRYCVPNGDPFTGEQRIDEATMRILISDVRIKRYIRDYCLMWNVLNPGSPQHTIYLSKVDLEKLEQAKIDIKDISGSSAQMKNLRLLFSDDPTVRLATSLGTKGRKQKDDFDLKALILKCLDVRCFGGVSTEKENNIDITGPIQFNVLNASLNKVAPRTHQNTSVFQSSTDKEQGAIGTTSLIPYALNNIVGEISPAVAASTGLTEDEVIFLMKACWHGVNQCRSRSKTGQNSRLLVKINYNDPNAKSAKLHKLVKIKESDDTNIRDIEEVTFDFSALLAHAQKPVVESVEYIVEEEVEKAFLGQMAPVASKLKRIAL